MPCIYCGICAEKDDEDRPTFHSGCKWSLKFIDQNLMKNDFELYNKNPVQCFICERNISFNDLRYPDYSLTDYNDRLVHEKCHRHYETLETNPDVLEKLKKSKVLIREMEKYRNEAYLWRLNSLELALKIDEHYKTLFTYVLEINTNEDISTWKESDEVYNKKLEDYADIVPDLERAQYFENSYNALLGLRDGKIGNFLQVWRSDVGSEDHRLMDAAIDIFEEIGYYFCI